MSDALLLTVIGLIAALAVAAALLRGRLQARRVATPPAAAVPESPTNDPAGEEQASLPATLAPIGKSLSAIEDNVSHPDQLSEFAEFKAATAALRRPDATLDLICQYALGDNWPMACAAFVVLAERPDRQAALDRILPVLPRLWPYPITFALRYFTALEKRPPLGTAFVAVQPWWLGNAVLPGSFESYLKKSAELSDPPVFGASLDQHQEIDTAPIVGMLRKVNHPHANELQAELRRWIDTRLDRDFLRTVGTLWDPAEIDPLLIEPETWRDAMAAAEAAILKDKPRSVAVCGDPRVGKTAFIKLLGRRLQNRGWTIFAASASELMADQIYIGQLEGQVRKVIEAVQARRKVIWYAPDFADMASSGSYKGKPSTILDQLFPDIAAGKLIVIGECGQAASARMFQARPSLRPLMEVVALQPMDDPHTEALAVQVGARLVEHAKLAVPPSAIGTTIDLAKHYLGSRQMPGAVLELLKRSADRAVGAGETALAPNTVIATLSQISGLPPIILDTKQKVELAEVRSFFTTRVMGQDEAVKAVVDRIAMLKAGLTDPGRPIGVFLFAGPTGTGKTELAKTLADFLFGSPDRMIRLDMSEFQSVEATSKIMGDLRDPSTESLASRIRKQPFSVVLLDEFEKAHPSCWDLFLQIFDDGRLTDAQGNEIDFRHCIIILTSNLGATAHKGGGLGFRPDADPFAAEQVLRAVAQTFRPEFVNRLDKVIVFQPLSRELMRGILHKELARIQERRGLRDRAWAVEWEPSAIEFLLDKGFSPEMGARPLKRAIDQQLLAPLAATLVEHRFPEGDQFLFVRSNGREIEVEFVDPDAEPASATPPPEEQSSGTASLPAIVLGPTGSDAEQATLVSFWTNTRNELASETWRAKEDALRLALADPSIWNRDDRHAVFAAIEVAGRIGEAARSAERLLQRYQSARRRGGRAARELGGRLALQLHNLDQGIADFRTDQPIDALIGIEPALDTATEADEAANWCRRLADMYRGWAKRRGMRLHEFAPTRAQPLLILHVLGFGALRTLEGERGLHVLEDDTRAAEARRIAARVTVVSGADIDLDGPAARESAEALLAQSTTQATTIVRRYREHPAPLVRDVAHGWRSGRTDAVLAGDFDLIGAVKSAQPDG